REPTARGMGAAHLDAGRHLRVVVRVREPALPHPEDVKPRPGRDPALDRLDPRHQPIDHGAHRADLGPAGRAHRSQARLHRSAGFQGLGFLGMAAARTLPEMLAARMLLGLMGAVSTFAFIMVGRSAGDVRRQVSYIQSGMTLGQVLGPATGAIVAARIGFRLSFVLGAVMLWAGSGLVSWGVPPGRPRDPKAAQGRPTSLRELVTVSLVVLAGSTQIFFLTSLLPQMLPPRGVATESTLAVGGLPVLCHRGG